MYKNTSLAGIEEFVVPSLHVHWGVKSHVWHRIDWWG